MLAAAIMVAALFGLNGLLDPEGRSTAVGLALLLAEGLAGAAIYLGALEVLRPGTVGRLRALLHTAATRSKPEAGGANGV
jgi:hypothetical protein